MGFDLIIRFSGACLFTPVVLPSGQHVTDVALLQSDALGGNPHIPQFSITNGVATGIQVPFLLSGYDITIFDGSIPTMKHAPGPHMFPGAVPLKSVFGTAKFKDGILWDGRPKDRICGSRIRLYDGKVTPLDNTGDEWQLVRIANGKPVKGTKRVVTTEFAFHQVVQNSLATFYFAKLGAPPVQVEVRPVVPGGCADVVIACPDSGGLQKREPGKKNRSKDFEMVFDVLDGSSNPTPCYLEQVNVEPHSLLRGTLYIPCVSGCSAC